MEALEVAHATWLRDVEFTSTFEYRDGEGKTFGAGPDQPMLKPALKYRGVFNKQGTSLRFSIRYDRPPLDTSPERNGLQVAFVPHDEVSNDSLAMMLADRPDQHSAAVAMVSRRRTDFATSPLDGVWSRDCFGPLCLSGGAYRGPFDIFRDPASNQGLVRSGLQVGDDRFEVRVVAEDEQARYERKAVFWTSPAPPVLVDIIQTDWPLDGGRPTFQFHSRASDFLDCPGGKVARVVRRVAELHGKVYVSEWISRDLGNRAPGEQDFRIVVPAYCRVAGVSDPPPTGTVRQLSLDDFSTSDLKQPRDPEPLIAPTGFPARWSQPMMGAVAVAVVAVAFGVAVWMWRKFK